MKTALFALCIGMVAAPAAKADVLNFNFTGTNGTTFASGTFTATPDGTNYDITGVSGTETIAGTVYNINGLVSCCGTPPAQGTTPDGLYYYNDVAFGPGPNLTFDNNGPVFTANNGAVTLESNLYTGTDGNSQYLSYTLLGTGVMQYNPGDLGMTSVTATPEPATWAMMLLGFASMGFLGYRKSKKGAGSMQMRFV